MRPTVGVPHSSSPRVWPETCPAQQPCCGETRARSTTSATHWALTAPTSSACTCAQQRAARGSSTPFRRLRDLGAGTGRRRAHARRARRQRTSAARLLTLRVSRDGGVDHRPDRSRARNVQIPMITPPREPARVVCQSRAGHASAVRYAHPSSSPVDALRASTGEALAGGMQPARRPSHSWPAAGSSRSTAGRMRGR